MEGRPARGPEYNREPCPDRILDDLGGAFGMGTVGGSMFHFAKGLMSSPYGHRLSGGLEFARMNAPRTGGMFAAWGGLFSVTDCALVYLRQKEDPWNSIIAGASAGGLLALRQGLRPAARHALSGGVLLACIEGLGIVLQKVGPALMPLPAPDQEAPGVNETGTSPVFGLGEDSVFGRWREKLGLGKTEPKRDESVQPNVLESEFVDSPTPMPTFEFK